MARVPAERARHPALNPLCPYIEGVRAHRPSACFAYRQVNEGKTMKMGWGMGLGLGLLTGLSACGSCQRPGGTGTDQQFFLVCPDPSNGCGSGNGTGVYFAEDGKAEIGPTRMMITHFINTGAQVNFMGRYFDPTSSLWYPLDTPGTVYAADFDGKTGLNVRSLEEAATLPTWTLQDPATSNPVVAKGDELVSRQLQLYIRFTIPLHGDPQQQPKFTAAVGARATTGRTVTLSYLLDFANPQHSGPAGHVVQTYQMRWRELTSGAAAVDYCGDQDGHADSVVYQQGVDVEPLSGSVSHNASSVTLSCSRGAPAVVYTWGYPHKGLGSNFFPAAIHMKRASYCGDNQYYTKTPTLIEIADAQGINNMPIQHLEARWTDHGATCVNQSNLRHSAMTSPASFICNGHALPKCDPLPSPLLEEGPVHPDL